MAQSEDLGPVAEASQHDYRLRRSREQGTKAEAEPKAQDGESGGWVLAQSEDLGPAAEASQHDYRLHSMKPPNLLPSMSS